MREFPLDVEALLGSISVIRQGGRDPAGVFVAAGVEGIDDDDLLAVVRLALRDRPDRIEIWQGWSYDKRWTPSPYLDGLEVGHYDAGYRHVRHHESSASACADFVLAEVRWVVERRIVERS